MHTGVQGIQVTTCCSGAGCYGNTWQLKWSWNDAVLAHAKMERSLAGGSCGYGNIAKDVYIHLSHEESINIYISSSSAHQWERHWNTPQCSRHVHLVTKCQCESPAGGLHRGPYFAPHRDKKREDEHRESPHCLVNHYTHMLHRDITPSLLASMPWSGNMFNEKKKNNLRVLAIFLKTRLAMVYA